MVDTFSELLSQDPASEQYRVAEAFAPALGGAGALLVVSGRRGNGGGALLSLSILPAAHAGSTELGLRDVLAVLVIVVVRHGRPAYTPAGRARPASPARSAAPRPSRTFLAPA